MLSATASARARGPDARPTDIALVLQTKYDPNKVHTLSEWAELARAAVEMVSAARDLMNLLPLPAQGVPDVVIR